MFVCIVLSGLGTIVGLWEGAAKADCAVSIEAIASALALYARILIVQLFKPLFTVVSVREVRWSCWQGADIFVDGRSLLPSSYCAAVFNCDSLTSMAASS